MDPRVPELLVFAFCFLLFLLWAGRGLNSGPGASEAGAVPRTQTLTVFLSLWETVLLGSVGLGVERAARTPLGLSVERSPGLLVFPLGSFALFQRQHLAV